MNILSLSESKKYAEEADVICNLIESNLLLLHNIEKNVKKKERITLDAASFDLIKSDRNIVFRIQREFSWYLKIPRNLKKNGLKREMAGAMLLKKVFKEDPFYFHANSIRSSTDKSYILYSEIPGRTLNIEFYYSCLPLLPYTKKIKHYFHNLGRVIAKFHLSSKSLDYSKDISDRDTVEVLKRAFLGCVLQNKMTHMITKWFLKIQPPLNENYIHGNLHLENIIVFKGKLSIIDLENCGQGPAYHDMGMLVAGLILTRSLPLFHRKRTNHAIRSFLMGYESITKYDERMFWDYVTMRVCIYYLERYCSEKKIKSRISGIPVSRNLLESLLKDLISGDIKAEFALR